jgi:glycosyltransferase involved in cell wall biosynthesis
MRVLFLIPSLSSLRGGSVNAAVGLAETLSKAHEVQLWTTSHDAEHVHPRAAYASQVRMFPNVLRQMPFFLSPSVIPALVSEIRQFDVVSVFELWTSWMAIGACVARARPSVPMFIHSQAMLLPHALQHHGKRKRIAQLLGGRSLLNSYAGVIACSPAEIPAIRAWGVRRPIHVLPTAVSPQPACRGAFRARQAILEDAPLVVYLGRFDQIKRVLELCQAFKAVQDRREDAVFVLAGDYTTSYGRKVREAARAAGLRAVFPGHLGQNEKWELLADADVLCQYSLQEGHSNSLMEGLAAGVPLVISSGCNFESVRETGAGMIVESVEEMSDAILTLLDSPVDRKAMGRRGLALAAVYSPDAIFDRYMEIVRGTG